MVRSAAAIECERLIRTVSPAENGWAGWKVTLWLPLEKEKAPVLVPLPRPKTRNVLELIEAGFTGLSKSMVTEVVRGAAELRGGATWVT